KALLDPRPFGITDEPFLLIRDVAVSICKNHLSSSYLRLVIPVEYREFPCNELCHAADYELQDDNGGNDTDKCEQYAYNPDVVLNEICHHKMREQHDGDNEQY